MTFTVAALRRAYLTRQWRDIIGRHPYVAVFQLTGGRSWGRVNMRARILGDLLDSAVVDAKYAVPWAARAGAEETRFKGLSNLFLSAPSAVVYGSEMTAVLAVIGRARSKMDGAILTGGRFGDQIVQGRVWDEVASMGSVEELHVDLVRLLSQPQPALLRLFDGQARQLPDVLGRSRASGSSVVRLLERHLAETERRALVEGESGEPCATTSTVGSVSATLAPSA